MGINSRKSLHPEWTSANVFTIDGFKTVTIRITRRDQSAEIVYDQVTKTYSNPDTIIVYEGSARIQPYGINLDVEVGNDPTARRLVLAQVSGKGLEINNDDVMTILNSNNNPDLEKYNYDVRGSIGSSLEWGTNLVCEANLKMSGV